MKKCPYCGKEYADDATVCGIDGESLPSLVVGRKKITGVWRGVFGYGQSGYRAGFESVVFTLKLKQGWLEHFTGSVTEDAPHGTSGMGIIEGYFNYPKIEFTKQMPVGYIVGADGTRMTLREHILAEGHKCEKDLPSSPILYQGIFLDANRVQGTWTINPRQIQLLGGLSITMGQTSGFWCAEFITSDPKVNPTGGPTESLFDKTLLSLRELNDVEGVAFQSLVKLNVEDAKKLLERFGQENIRFELKRDDNAMRQMMPITEVTGGYVGAALMIEIFVHPDDEEKAVKVMNEGDQT